MPSADPRMVSLDQFPSDDGFSDLPTDLRQVATDLLHRFVTECGALSLSRHEIARAIRSPAFRSILEQEARLNALGMFN